MKSLTIELVSMHLRNYFHAKQSNTLSSCANFLPYQLNLEGQREVVISEISYPSIYQNARQGKNHIFLQNTFNLVRILLSGTQSVPFNHRFCGSHGHVHARETQSHRIFYHSQSVSKHDAQN